MLNDDVKLIVYPDTFKQYESSNLHVIVVRVRLDPYNNAIQNGACNLYLQSINNILGKLYAEGYLPEMFLYGGLPEWRTAKHEDVNYIYAGRYAGFTHKQLMLLE